MYKFTVTIIRWNLHVQGKLVTPSKSTFNQAAKQYPPFAICILIYFQCKKDLELQERKSCMTGTV